jgi:hypothetical protein
MALVHAQGVLVAGTALLMWAGVRSFTRRVLN